MSTTKKRGRPVDGEERETLTFIGFKADDEVMRALEQLLEGESKGSMVGRRSQVIRRAILESAERSKKGKTR